MDFQKLNIEFSNMQSMINKYNVLLGNIKNKIKIDSKELLKYELDLFGFYLSNHPVTEYKNKYNVINLLNIDEYFDKNVELVLLVNNVKTIVAKNNKKMMFITGSDEVSNIDLTLFSDVYERIDEEIKVGTIIYTKGKCEKRNGRYQIIVSEIKPL